MARVPESKIVVWERVEALAQQLAQRQTAVVTTNGCFDLLHLGHLHGLWQARAHGACLWVGVNSDASVARLKGPSRPVQDQHTRVLQLAAVEAVDYVTVFEGDTPEEWLRRVRPQVHVKGGDYRPEDLPEGRTVQAGGGKVICVPLEPGYSTTALIEKIRLSFVP